jgi:hypothetical protein
MTQDNLLHVQPQGEIIVMTLNQHDQRKKQKVADA